MIITGKSALIVLMLLMSAQVSAIESIKVLIAKTSNVSDAQALSMLGQINLLTNNSGLSNMQFVNANTTTFVKLASTCTGSNYQTLLAGC